MKKFLIFLCAFTLVAGVSLSAGAAMVTITFDEPGITSGDINIKDRYDGTQIDTEYTALYGITWVDTIDDNPNEYTGQGVTLPYEFSGTWSDTGNMLWNYGLGGGGTTPVNAPILLAVPANYFSFDFRKPQSSSSVDVSFYMDDVLVYAAPTFIWDPLAGDNDWKTFVYDGGELFNKVVLDSPDKFNSDNYTFNMVPVPASLWLLASGLVVPVVRRRKKKAE